MRGHSPLRRYYNKLIILQTEPRRLFHQVLMYANTSSRISYGEMALYHFNHRITEYVSRPFLQKCRLGQLSPSQMLQIYPPDVIEGQAVLVFTF